MKTDEWEKWRRVLCLDKEPILAEQLRLLLSNLGTSFALVLIVVILLVWVLLRDSNGTALLLWAASVLAVKLTAMFYARYTLRNNTFTLHSCRAVTVLILLSAIYGMAWGLLAWVALDTSALAEGILIMAVLAGVTSNAISIFSPVLPISIAFCFFELSVVAGRLWHMEALAFKTLALIVALYVAILISEARRVAAATRSIINLRFELEESHQHMREIEQREILSKERQRLMEDMHDGLGSSLTSALRAAEHGKAGTAELAQILRDCVDDLKLAIDSMEPVDTDLLLLLATLRYRMSPRLENCGISLRWEVQPLPKLDWLNPEKSLHVLRILQEAFSNIVKHANAAKIHVSTSVAGEFVVVKIHDDGIGFSPLRTSTKGGRGLSNQLRRAAMIGASIQWGLEEEGTCFILKLPFEQSVQGRPAPPV